MTEQREKPAPLPVPIFASREEEVAFWDTHDVTDHVAFDGFGPFEGEVAPSVRVTLRIDPETWEEVEKPAPARDLPPDGLLHLRIPERRDAERERRRAGSANGAAERGSPLPANRLLPEGEGER